MKKTNNIAGIVLPLFALWIFNEALKEPPATTTLDTDAEPLETTTGTDTPTDETTAGVTAYGIGAFSATSSDIHELFVALKTQQWHDFFKNVLDKSDRYNQRELESGLRAYRDFFSRHLERDNQDSIERVKECLANPTDNWALDRFSWLLDGSYGDDKRQVAMNWARQLAEVNTIGRFRGRLRMFAINLFQLLGASDLEGINEAKARAILKTNTAAMEEFTAAIESKIVAWFLDYEF